MPRPRREPAEPTAPGAPAKRATLKDVARLAGVSPMTVSRALARPELVLPATRARVRDVVEQTGFVPNSLAGGLTSGQTRLIALAVPTMAHSLFSDMAESCIDLLAQRGYQAVLGITRYDDAREEAWVEAILSRRPDGIALTGTGHSARTKRLLLGSGVPVVEMWDYSNVPLGMSVGFVQEDLGRAAWRHLAGQGYRRPALLRSDDARAGRRAAGFRQAALEADQPPPAEIVFSETEPQAARGHHLDALLAADAGVDAVFCSSDALAQGVIAHAHARGLAVPDRLGVLGFGDQALALNTVPSLSSVGVNGLRIGEMSARALLRRIGGEPPQADDRLDVGFEVVPRASTARR